MILLQGIMAEAPTTQAGILILLLSIHFLPLVTSRNSLLKMCLFYIMPGPPLTFSTSTFYPHTLLFWAKGAYGLPGQEIRETCQHCGAEQTHLSFLPQLFFPDLLLSTPVYALFSTPPLLLSSPELLTSFVSVTAGHN